MSLLDAELVTIAVADAVRVSGLLHAPPRARACCVLGHGAGAGLAHAFMAAVAAELGRRDIALAAWITFVIAPPGGVRETSPREAAGCRAARP